MAVAGAALDKKALDIVLIDMRKMSSVCDYFVIASGTSTTHVGAIADSIEKTMSQEGQRLWHIEGKREASWVLLDLSDVVAHIFLEDTRKFYALEKLWKDAPQMRFRDGRIVVKASKKKRPVSKKTRKRAVLKSKKKASGKKKRKA
ncbi:MAG TPA: ribosome silencing factor [Candidatus Omnitrophota bacterium]|nr:ribosome silencing factor [Candidatus Omnitrophota bacterium]